MKRYLLILLLVILFFSGFSSEKNKTHLSIELFSQHYWRGTQMGNMPVIEPTISYTLKGFSFSFWAAFTSNKSYTEIDLIPSYTYKNISLILFDYYNPVLGKENNYFNFQEGKSRHSLELALSYKGQKELPINYYIGTFIYGDKNPKTGKPYFSTYAEITYPFSFIKTNFEIHAGFTPHKSYYANKSAIVSSGIKAIKTIKISSQLEIPIKVSMVFNPDTSKAFYIFGVGISKI